MNKYNAVVLGATGLIGHHLLAFLLADEDFKTVTALTRRNLSITHPKLIEEIVNFENNEELKLKIGAYDVTFCCIGTTMKKTGGDRNKYRKIDYDIPVEIGKIAFDNGCKNCVFVSSVGADPNSGNFYLQLKGKAEKALASIPFQSLHIFRPSILLGKREEYRPGEKAAKKLMKFFSRLFIGKFTKYRAIEATEVAKAMVISSKSNLKSVVIYEYIQIKSLL